MATLRGRTCPVKLDQYRASHPDAKIDFSNGPEVSGYVSPETAGVLCDEGCEGASLVGRGQVAATLIRALLQRAVLQPTSVVEVCGITGEQGASYQTVTINGAHTSYIPN